MNKRGFTLVEMAAIIVVIGLVIGIAIPTSLDIMEKSKEKAFTVSVEGYLKAIETDNFDRGGTENSYNVIDGKVYHAATNEEIKVKNDTKETGTITITNLGKITAVIDNKKYCAVADGTGSKISITKYDASTCNNGSVYVENILNGADPELDDGMIPVIINNDGTVKKADVNTLWYSYASKKWANVVLVTSGSRDKYKNAVPDTTINSADILSYLVWVPRYKYKISTAGTSTASSTDIVFENKSTSKSVGNATTEYYTHPAFSFGTTELNGLWVGKFEPTGSETTPTILPNVGALRSQTLSVQFATAQKFKNSTTYGVTSDAHMMKNSEWGAIVYLSHSIYGINTEIRLNNSSNYITGCGSSTKDGASTTSCQIVYGSNIASYPQSNTGNISGIFDLAGGSWERMMSLYTNTLGSSGFTTLPDAKYYDVYTTTTINNACAGAKCLGHALSETSGWQGDYVYFVTTSRPWIYRGGSHSYADEAGIFATGSDSGASDATDSFRLIIAPKA